MKDNYSSFGTPLPGRTYNAMEDMNKVVIAEQAFASGTDSWTTGNSSTTVANSSGQLRLQTTNTGAVSMSKTYTTTSGTHYRISFDADAASYTNVSVDIVGYGGTALSSATLNTGITHYQLDFTANDASTIIKVSFGTGTGTRTIYIDNVKLEEIKGDISKYAYNFNGKELDDEGLGGGGSTYDYGFRIYNPNLGRFLSVDPLTKSYPWYTPYQFAGNKPIMAIDLDGMEEANVNTNTKPTDPNLIHLKDVTTAIDKQLTQSWNNSVVIGPEGRKTEEWGFGIFLREITRQVISTGETIIEKTIVTNQPHTDHEAGSIDVHLKPPAMSGSLSLLGEAHTHPFTSSLNFGIPFSSDDISGLRDNVTQGYTSLVEAGDQRFAIVISDPTKAAKFFQEKNEKEIAKMYNQARKEYKGSGTDNAAAIKHAILSVLKDSGLQLYETIDSKKLDYQEVTEPAKTGSE